MIDQVKAILRAWDNVRVEDNGAYWLVAGSYHGQAHAGTRADPISLAHDLVRIASGFDAGQWAPEPATPLSPDPAPQDIAPPVADVPPDSEAVGGASAAYPGLFLQRDDQARLRSDVIMAITLCERRRLQADVNVNRTADFLQAIVDYHNTAGAGQTMTDDLRWRYDEAMRFQQREAQIRAHADQLRSAAIVADMLMLQAMIDAHEEGWP